MSGVDWTVEAYGITLALRPYVVYVGSGYKTLRGIENNLKVSRRRNVVDGRFRSEVEAQRYIDAELSAHCDYGAIYLYGLRLSLSYVWPLRSVLS